MYNEKMEKLITIALFDGELTEKKRDVLSYYADEFDLDDGEFELVLDARLVERQKELANGNVKPESIEGFYDKELEKLISLALVDGNLTEKKREILTEKAYDFDDDFDEAEFEMVLDAKLAARKYEMGEGFETKHSVVAGKSEERYDSKLEKLIDLALADGVLTDKEKELLFRKAKELGVDQDEFEMVLEGRLSAKTTELSNNNNSKKSEQKPRKNQPLKCPACGDIAESFATHCRSCGQEFRGAESSSSITAFFEKLDAIEVKTTSSTSFFSEFSWFSLILYILFFWILIPYHIIKLIIQKNSGVSFSREELKKESLIENFPIPNSKEDLLEFITLGASHISKHSYMNVLTENSRVKDKWNEVWMKKIKQVYDKAKISMKEDKATLSQISQTYTKCNDILEANQKKVKHILIPTIVYSLIVLIVGGVYGYNYYKTDTEHKAQIVQVKTLIKEKKYDEAKKFMGTITFQDKNEEVEIKSGIGASIQFDKLIAELDAVVPLIEKKKYKEAQKLLNRIRWVKEYGTNVEERYYRRFANHHFKINILLPEKLRGEHISEYDFGDL